MKLNRDDFKQYVCCQKCCAVYDFNDCFQQVGGQRVPKHCSACKFPRHPRPSLRGCCDSILLKHIQTSRKEAFKAIKMYCYKPLVSSLIEILSRPGMVDTCERWRYRPMTSGLLADVYDGNIWTKFESEGYFSQPHAYGLIFGLNLLSSCGCCIYGST